MKLLDYRDQMGRAPPAQFPVPGWSGTLLDTEAQRREDRVPQIWEEFERLKWLREDETGDIAEPPSDTAIAAAEGFLEASVSLGLEPQRVMACADGGVTLFYERNQRIAVLEFFNSGTVVLATSSGPGTTSAVEVEPYDQVVSEISEFLD